MTQEKIATRKVLSRPYRFGGVARCPATIVAATLAYSVARSNVKNFADLCRARFDAEERFYEDGSQEFAADLPSVDHHVQNPQSTSGNCSTVCEKSHNRQAAFRPSWMAAGRDVAGRDLPFGRGDGKAR